MADSVYKVIELVGTSTDSWERAADAAIDRASSTLRDLRVAEVKELDVSLDEDGIKTYRAKLSVSFKYEGGD
jgi:dodecin